MGGDADGVTLGETIEDESNLDADESSLMSGLKDDMTKLLATLPEREAVVMRMRYGLDGDVFTLDEIGRSLKVRRAVGNQWGALGCRQGVIIYR